MVVASVWLPEGVLYQRNPTEIDLVGTHTTRSAVHVQQRFMEDVHANYVTSGTGNVLGHVAIAVQGDRLFRGAAMALLHKPVSRDRTTPC